MVSYDPKVIQQHAQRLYGRARSITVSYTVGFTLIGLLGGAALGFSSELTFQLFLAVAGGASLGALGFAAGQARGFELRLEAQVALCQAQIELNTRYQSAAANHAQPHFTQPQPTTPTHAQPGLAHPR